VLRSKNNIFSFRGETLFRKQNTFLQIGSLPVLAPYPQATLAVFD